MLGLPSQRTDATQVGGPCGLRHDDGQVVVGGGPMWLTRRELAALHYLTRQREARDAVTP